MEFKSSNKLTLIYWLCSLWFIISIIIIIIVLGVNGRFIPMSIFIGLLAIALGILNIWIPRFYRSIILRLESDHAYAKFGVW